MSLLLAVLGIIAAASGDCPSALAQDADDGDRTAVPDAYKEA